APISTCFAIPLHVALPISRQACRHHIPRRRTRGAARAPHPPATQTEKTVLRRHRRPTHKLPRSGPTRWEYPSGHLAQNVASVPLSTRLLGALTFHRRKENITCSCFSPPMAGDKARAGAM